MVRSVGVAVVDVLLVSWSVAVAGGVVVVAVVVSSHFGSSQRHYPKFAQLSHFSCTMSALRSHAL